jgi:hypothetical protein
LSRDGTLALTYTTRNPQQPGLTDLALASLVTPGSRTVLSATPTALPAPFTLNSAHADYFLDEQLEGGLGAFYTQSTADGSAAVVLAHGSNWPAQTVGPTGVVLCDNAVEDAGWPPTSADIEWVDVARSAAPTTLGARAVPTASDPTRFFLTTPSRDAVVYVAPAPSGAFGLYVTTFH